MQKIRMIKEDAGMYIYATHKRREDVLQNLYSGMNKSKTQLNYLDSVYVYPKSLVTRNLVSKAKDRFNITQIRKKDKADKLILSTKHIEDLFVFDHYAKIYKYERAKLLEIYNYVLNNWDTINASSFTYWKPPKASITDWRNAVKTFSDENDMIIALNRGSNLEYFLDTNNPVELEYKQFLDSQDKHILSYITEENNTELQSLWKSRNKVFTEEAFINLVNNDNRANHNDFTRIQEMLNSSDEANKEIGATLLSNFSWAGNEDLLMFLLFKHIDWLRYSKSYNGASFKAIKSLYKNYRHSTSSHATLIKKLFEDGKLTSAGLKEFLEDKAKDLNNTYHVSNQFFSFTIDSINLPKEYNEIRSKL